MATVHISYETPQGNYAQRQLPADKATVKAVLRQFMHHRVHCTVYTNNPDRHIGGVSYGDTWAMRTFSTTFLPDQQAS